MIKTNFFLLIAFLVTSSWASFLDLDGTSSHTKGPNCWNGAMFAAGVIDHRRFMHPEEWKYYLNKNCREVSRAVPGAVGRLFLEESGEVHGFIHLDENTVFAKHGEDQAHGYRVMSYVDMLNQYGRTRSCRTANRTDEECYHDLKYYLCENSQAFSEPLLKINEALENLSFSSNTKLNFRDDCSSESFNAREEQLEIIKNAIMEIANMTNRDTDLEGVLFHSYSHQLYNIQVSNRNYRCQDRKQKHKKVKEVRMLLKSTFSKE